MCRVIYTFIMKLKNRSVTKVLENQNDERLSIAKITKMKP